MSRHSFVKATEPAMGQRAKRVAGILDLLADAEGPLPFKDACEQLGIEQPSQLLPAMHALEFVGAVDRYTFVDKQGTRAQVAYAFTERVEIIEIADVLEDDTEEA